VLGKRIRNEMDLIELSRRGVTKSALSHLAKNLNVATTDMATFLPITERTIQRYKWKDHFKPNVSEHILQLAGLVASGFKVFDSQQQFLAWIKRPNKALGNEAPIKLLDSRFGVRMVRDELGRIEHGIIS
jgi:putative toxin-antitoxin system antitoxin component (TIGR02293 family)